MSEAQKARLRIVSLMRDPGGEKNEIKHARPGMFREEGCGLSLTLENGALWTVTEPSYLTALTIDASSSVTGWIAGDTVADELEAGVDWAELPADRVEKMRRALFAPLESQGDLMPGQVLRQVLTKVLA